MDLIRPLLIEGEVVEAALRESFKFETFFRKWLILTNIRLIIGTRTVTGAMIEEYHLKEMDIEIIHDDVGFYDSVLFKNKEMLLYNASFFRSRRKDVAQFVGEISKHIAERDLTQFNADRPHPRAPLPKREEPLSRQDIKACAVDLEHKRDLKTMGVISEEEYEEEEAKPCKKK